MSALVLVVLAQAAFSFEVPGRIDEVSVEAAVTTAGYPVHLSAARSRWPAAELLTFYAKAMVDAGLYVAPPGRQPRLVSEVHLTGLDTARFVAYTVVLQPQRRGTTVMMMAAQLGQSTPLEGERGVPIYPTGGRPIASTTEGSTVTTYSARQVTPRALGAWYRAMLEGAGWVESRATPLQFQRAGRELQVHASPSRDGAITVTVIER